jgi:hypothetical protein
MLLIFLAPAMGTSRAASENLGQTGSFRLRLLGARSGMEPRWIVPGVKPCTWPNNRLVKAVAGRPRPFYLAQTIVVRSSMRGSPSG